MEVTFRPLSDDDLPLLHRWLNEPDVVRWWEGEDVSWEAVVAQYGSTSEDYPEHWVALIDSREVGWIQCYAVAEAAEDPEDPSEAVAWLDLGVEPTAASIDYLIGDPEDRRRGVGPEILRSFVDDVVFGRHPDWTQVCASPYVANRASWRALEKAGFAFVADFAHEDGLCRLMVRDGPGPRSLPKPDGGGERDRPL